MIASLNTLAEDHLRKAAESLPECPETAAAHVTAANALIRESVRKDGFFRRTCARIQLFFFSLG